METSTRLSTGGLFAQLQTRAEELKAQIEARAASKFRVQPSQKKHRPQHKRGRDDPTPLSVDPCMLKLMPATFEAGGKEIAQITFDEVKRQGSGLAFASPADLAPFLRQGEIISDQALAVLCTGALTREQCNGLSSTDLRFPAVYSGTGEPILLSGSLLQLGRIPVSRSQGASHSVDSVQTQTLRIMVFRDAWVASWSDFTKQPFRCVLHEMPDPLHGNIGPGGNFFQGGPRLGTRQSSTNGLSSNLLDPKCRTILCKMRRNAMLSQHTSKILSDTVVRAKSNPIIESPI